MQGMRMHWVMAAILLAASPAHAQRSASSLLAVEVGPEAQVQPAQTSLQLVASDAGNTTYTVVVTARVRAAPGATIHLRATVSNFTGPNGSAAAGVLTWTAAATQSSGGGTQASCGSGSFGSGATQDLAQGWTKSGSLQCTLTFQISEGAAAGSYSGEVRFRVSTK